MIILFTYLIRISYELVSPMLILFSKNIKISLNIIYMNEISI